MTPSSPAERAGANTRDEWRSATRTARGRSARSTAAFERLFHAHYRAVEAFVAAQFPNADLAEVMSSTFSTAWRRFDEVPVEASRGWLIGVARNTALGSLRGRRRRAARHEAFRTLRPRGVVDLHAYDVPPETTEQLTRAFDGLAPNDQEIIQLAAFDGLTGVELAGALGISQGAAAVRLHRARQRLSEAYRRQVAS